MLEARPGLRPVAVFEEMLRRHPGLDPGVRRTLDRQYRTLLDEPVPMLGDVSPRAASKTARGRKSLVTWLKHLESHSRHAEGWNDPMATYDFGWMWRELKVEHLRN